MANPEHQSTTSNNTWSQREHLSFGIQERSILQILMLITYKEQAEGLAKNLTNLLTDKSFPQIRDL